MRDEKFVITRRAIINKRERPGGAETAGLAEAGPSLIR